MANWLTRTLLPGAAVVLFAAGCATPRRTVRPQPRPLGAQYVAAAEPRSGGAGEREPRPAEPAEILNLEQALALALLRNPELTAFSYDVRAAEASILQARLLPNPELESNQE